MDGKRAEGTTKIYALINSLREEGLVLTLEAVYSHGQADGSVLVAAVGLVGRVNRRLEGSVDSSDFDDDEEDDDGDVPATFVEVFVLKQKAGMGGYFVTDDMLHLLSGPLEPVSEPRSPSVCRQKLRETLEQLHEARMARAETEEELRLLKSHVTSSGMEIQMLRQSLEEAQAENEAKTTELRDMTAHVSEVEAHAAASERELIADLTAKQNMAVQHMDERLGSLKDQLQHSSRTRDELRESVDALQSQLTESRAECRAHKEEVDKLRNQSASLQKEVAQLKMRVTAQAAADESHGLRRRIEELQQEVKSARCALEHAETMSEQKLQRQTTSEQKLQRLLNQTFEKLKQRTDEVHVYKKERDIALESLQKQETLVYRLEREKELAKNELKTCRLSLKEKDKNRELPRELDAADDARSSKSERSRVRGSPTAHEQQQQQKQTTDLLLEEKRALEAQTAELAQQLEDAQEGLKGREQELQAVRDTMQQQLENLEQARDAAKEHARKLEVMMSKQAKDHEDIAFGKARAEDQLLQMRRDMDMLSHHLQEARATASGKEADARAACQDAQSAQRDVSLWKDKYETSQLQVRDRHICLDLDIFCLEQHMLEYRGIL